MPSAMPMPPRGGALTLEVALNMFMHCHSPMACFDQLLGIPFFTSDEIDQQTVVHACVLKMYQMPDLDLCNIKEMLWSEPVTRLNQDGHNLDYVRGLWRDNVGPLEDTLHWLGDTLVRDIERMRGTFSVEELQACFAWKDTAKNALSKHLSHLCIGVMDVFFLSACFQFPVVQRMGSLFWKFAKAFVVLQVPNADLLNYLMWDVVLAQTVLVLEPTFYAIDSLMEPISVPITIRGSRNQQGQQTIMAIASHANLWFLASVRLSTLCLEHYVTDQPNQAKFLLRLIGTRGLRLTAEITDVDVVGAGIEANHFWSVTCSNVNFENAKCGLHATSAFMLNLKGEPSDHILDVTPGFNRCELALYARDVSHVVLSNQFFERPLQVFEVQYTAACIIKNCTVEFRDVDSLGAIMGPQPPVLENFQVIQVQKASEGHGARYLKYTISDLSCVQSLAPLITRRNEEA